MIAVQMGDEHGGDLAWVKPGPLQCAEGGGTAVQQNRAAAAWAKVDARLKAAATAESVTAAGEGNRHGGAAQCHGSC